MALVVPVVALGLLETAALPAQPLQEEPPQAVPQGKVLVALGTLAALGTGGSGGSAGGLFFREYVEGDTNTALELYNAGTAPVDLSKCYVKTYADGVNPLYDTQLSGTLAPGKTYVICSLYTAGIVSCDLGSGDIRFNGNDALVLHCDSGVLDHIGQVGMNPPNGNANGAYWGTEPVTTQNHTLRRKCSIQAGDPNTTASFDPADQWDGFSSGDMSDLGKHCQ